MSVLHPSPAKLEALRARWAGQEARLSAVAACMRAGLDWTVHLRGLPHLEEIPPLPGEAYGRDLRGADLRRWLRLPVEIRQAGEGEAAIVAGLVHMAHANATSLPDISPIPADLDGADRTALSMRRGDVFFVARSGDTAAGTIRVATRREFSELLGGRQHTSISDLAVLPAWRRQGIGEALLRAAEQHAEDDGLEDVLLCTFEEMGLVPWYGKLGYNPVRVRQIVPRSGTACLEVVMTKRIGAAARRASSVTTVDRLSA